MKFYTITISLFVIIFLNHLTLANAQETKRFITDQEEFARQVDMPSYIKIIEIKHRGGNLNITGWDKPYVLIEGTKKATAETVDYARIILEKIEIIAYESPGARLVLEFSGPPIEWRVPDDDVSISYTAHVPKNLFYDISLDVGDIAVSDINGRVSIDHRAGSATVTDIDNRVQLRSSGGLIKVNNIARDLKLDTQESKVEINNVNQTCAIRHKIGDISITNVKQKLIMNTMKSNVRLNQIHGRLDIDHRNGDITAENFFAGVRLYLYDGQVRLSPHIPIPQNYYIVVDNGDVILRVPEKSSMLAEIEAMQGSIHSDFPMPIWADKAVSTSKGAINGGENIVNISVKNGHVSLFKELEDEISSRSQREVSTAQSSKPNRRAQPTPIKTDGIEAVEIP